ncbi:MAG: cell division protein FtsQ/DivIB [Betaproteobacteria bacterium]
MWHSVWKDAAVLNRVSALLLLFALGVFGCIAVKRAAAHPAFAIHSVVVTGDIAHADPAHITSVVQHGLRGTFFTLDLAAARDALQKVPWVRQVSVRRQWPGRLAITIEEHQPLARWNDDSLVNMQGEVFDAEYGEELPDFYGPDGSSAELAARYKDFAAQLAALQLGIDTLSRSARGAWEVKLEDGMTIALGREQVNERWTRWMRVSERYRDRIAQGGQLAALDMRYVNGFAARIIGGMKEPAKKVAAPRGKPSPVKRG